MDDILVNRPMLGYMGPISHPPNPYSTASEAHSPSTCIENEIHDCEYHESS